MAVLVDIECCGKRSTASFGKDDRNWIGVNCPVGHDGGVFVNRPRATASVAEYKARHQEQKYLTIAVVVLGINQIEN